MAGEVTLDEMIEEVEREIRLREKIYPRWVTLANPKLSATQAALQLARMKAVREFLVARHPKNLKITIRPDPLSQALNEGDGVYRP